MAMREVASVETADDRSQDEGVEARIHDDFQEDVASGRGFQGRDQYHEHAYGMDSSGYDRSKREDSTDCVANRGKSKAGEDAEDDQW